MAYPVIPAAYGLRPQNLIGGLPFAGSTRMVPIANAYGTSLFYGDPVILAAGLLNASGFTLSTTSPVAGTMGIFLGCSYTLPQTGQKVFQQFWQSGTAANDAIAYVCDDPSTVFKAVVMAQSTALANSGLTVGALSASFLGTNVYAIPNAGGSLTTGDSSFGVSGGVITSGTAGGTRVTTTLPFRVVGLVPETQLVATAVGSTAGSSTTVTLTAANTAIIPGMQIIAPGSTGALQGNYRTVMNVNGTTLTVDTAVTIASGTVLTFVGYPEVLVKWNQGYHSYQNASGV